MKIDTGSKKNNPNLFLERFWKGMCKENLKYTLRATELRWMGSEGLLDTKKKELVSILSRILESEYGFQISVQ